MDFFILSICICNYRTYLKELREFLLRVKNHDHHWGSRYMFTTPFDFNAIVSWLSRLIFAQNCSILLRFSLHFHSECA